MLRHASFVTLFITVSFLPDVSHEFIWNLCDVTLTSPRTHFVWSRCSYAKFSHGEGATFSGYMWQLSCVL